MPRRRLKPIVAAAALLVACLALEGVVRLTREPPVYIELLGFDPDLGFTLPGPFDGVNFDERGRFPYLLNSQGFRGPELPPEGTPKPAGAKRILFLGDSFLTASSVREEELMAKVCARTLHERGIPAETYTVCCDDYGTAQELLLLERYGERVQPDWLVLAVYPPNDVANNSLNLAGMVETSAGDYIRPYLVPDGAGGFERTWAQPVRAFLRRHLRSFALLDRALITRAKTGAFAWYAPWPLTHPWLDERLRAGQAPAEWLEVFREHDPGHPWERAWRVTRELVLAVGARARALDARLLVLVIPACHQAELNAVSYRLKFEIEQHGGGGTLHTFDLNLPEQRMAAFCREADIDVRLLLEPLRAAVVRSGRTSYQRDGHLNGRGNALAGAIVADWITGGDEFPSARADAPLSAPGRLLPPSESAPRWLDLQDEQSGVQLGEGWLPYLATDTGRFSWASSSQSVLLLPLPSGDRVTVEGWLPPHAQFPSTMTIEVPGLGRVQQQLEAPGPFQAALALSAPTLAGRLTPVFLSFSETFHPEVGDWRRFGAILTGAGIR